MKKKIRILIVAMSSLLLTMLIATVFAAYTYVKDITLSNKVGVIDIDSKSYYNYAADNTLDEDDDNYKKQSKLRKDTVAVLDGIILSSTSTYVLTGDSIFINGKTYYVQDENDDEKYNVADVEVGATVTSDTYYEEVKEYTGISKVGTCYDSSLTTIETTISTNVITLTVSSTSLTITTTIDSTNGVITEAAITVTGKNYKAVIDADGLGMVIIDTDITSAASGYTEISASSAITCSASGNKYSNSNIYLSQLGLHFAFTSEVAVYVRIHIQDAWKRSRVYASSVKENYILKDQVSGQSPFTVSDDDWYYDNKTNCVYLKEMYVPTQNADGTYPQQAYTFNVNEAYYYNAISTSAYTEYVDVQVSFTVDVVQANRAKALWGVDPSTIVSN